MTPTITSSPPLVFDVQDLSFTYDRMSVRPPAIHNVTCAVEAGTIVGVIGPNGSGKTSLLKLLMGLLRPSSGAIRVFGRDADAWSTAERARRMAFVPQETAHACPLTVGELALTGRFPFHRPFDGWGWDAPADVQRAARAMRDVGVASLADRPVSDVSGGERQRAMMARALTQDPDVLLLDEPTAFLDLHHQLDMARMLRQLNRDHGLTVVMVSHDLNLASQCCDQLWLLHRGAIVARGRPSDVMRPETLASVYQCDVVIDQHPHSSAPRVTLPV